jgi:hypothetical protein
MMDDTLREKIAAIIQEEPDLQGPSGVPHDSSMGMAARILALPEIALGGWQPIETAPKDGTWLLLFVPGGVDERSCDVETAPPFTIGYWSPQDMQAAAWYSVEGYSEFYDFGGITGAGMSQYQCTIKPTYWMHLPSPPSIKVRDD